MFCALCSLQRLSNTGVQSDKYDAVEKTLKSVQDRLNKFLAAEEAAMENRIRYFQTFVPAYPWIVYKKNRSGHNFIALSFALWQGVRRAAKGSLC